MTVAFRVLGGTGKHDQLTTNARLGVILTVDNWVRKRKFIEKGDWCLRMPVYFILLRRNWDRQNVQTSQTIHQNTELNSAHLLNSRKLSH